MRGRISPALALWAAAGCADQTALLVEVTSPDLVVGADVDGLRFEATADGDAMADIALVVAGPWPHSLAIRPGRAPEDAEVEIAVTALFEGRTVVRRVVRARFSPGETVVVPVVLERACVGVPCPAGVDCVGGRCATGGPDGGAADSGVPTDGGGALDAGGTLDGGARDGGGRDAGGPRDGGARDGGRDGGCRGPEVCGGGDEDCDGRVDEGLPCPGSLVISEVATGGPAGGADEFVELYNRTGTAIALDGVLLEYRPGTSTGWSRRGTLPVGARIPAHGYYLLGSAGYSRSPAADPGGGWTSGFAITGGHLRIVAGGAELDRLGWGTAIEPEGTAVPALASDAAASHERKAAASSTTATMAPGGADERRGNAHDTDDNAADFVPRASAEPQGTASAAEMP